MSRLRMVLLVGIAAVLFCGMASAGEFYVDAEAGSDSNSGTSADNAWLTITHALSSVEGRPDDPVTIYIAAGTYSASTNGERFPLEMKSHVSLIGAGADVTILDAEDDAYHVIYCSELTSVTVEGLRITRGVANGDYVSGDSSDRKGGGVYCEHCSDVLIKNCVITGNYAEHGAGIYLFEASPVIDGCEITSNEKPSDLTGYSWGGGIYAHHSGPTVINSTIAENGSFWGGGIYFWLAGGSIEQCTISKNHISGASAFPYNEGGGIYLDESSTAILNCTISQNDAYKGAGIYCERFTGTIEGCAITDNAWTTYAWYESWGGGIYIADSEFTVRGCEIVENLASSGAGISCSNSSGSISGCLISRNVDRPESTLEKWGGGIRSSDCSLTIEGCTITENSANQGAGLYCYNSATTILHCTISSNEAQVNADDGSWGGGIHFRGSSGDDTVGLISGCTITENSALNGGGVYCLDAECLIENCEVSRNIAPLDDDGFSYGGGIFCRNSAVTVDGCQVSLNTASDGAGVYMREASGSIRDCAISHNEAPPGSARGGTGGAILCNRSSPKIENCAIAGNRACRGGGIHCCSSSPLVSGCVMESNVAVGNALSRSWGGGLFSYMSTPEIQNCVVTGNSAWSGAGLAFTHSPCAVKNCLITDNSATVDCEDYSQGGGVVCFGLSLDIGNCTITGNSAFHGGGIQCAAGSWVSVTDTVLSANGGEIGLKEDSAVSISQSCIEGGYDGEGNIQADPLFVTGPFGDYYLSCEAAGQGEDSPCIDAGSDAAETLGLDELTTRTDSEVDSGIVDIGYHYPIYLGQATIECSLNASSFRPGDYLVGSLKVANDGPDIEVDVYVAFVLPDGAIFCITPHGGLTSEILPWIRYMPLPENYSFGPAPMFEAIVPGGLPFGDYLFAAALSTPGEFAVVGDLSLFPFTLRAETLSASMRHYRSRYFR